MFFPNVLSCLQGHVTSYSAEGSSLWWTASGPSSVTLRSEIAMAKNFVANRRELDVPPRDPLNLNQMHQMQRHQWRLSDKRCGEVLESNLRSPNC